MTTNHNDTEFVRQLTLQLRQSPPPEAGAAVLARIHATLAVRPEQPVVHVGARWVRRVAMVTAAAVVVAAVALRDTDSVAAGAMAGTLRFEPASPQPGQAIRVRYEPSAALARFDHVRLRGRFRTASDIPGNWLESQVTVTRLDADSAGTFVGSFVFPESAVFGAFTVEDEERRYVDANHRSLWTLLASNSAGVPTFEALEQRISDVATTNWELALATAERVTKLHPDQVRGWVILYTLQQSMLSRTGRDSARASYRTRLPSLDERFVAGDVSSDELGAMVSFARMLRDTVRAKEWSDRLAWSNPRGVWGLNAAMEGGFAQLRTNPRAALAYFDSVWHVAGSVHPGITNFGLAAAQAVKDSAAISIWFHRSLSSAKADSVMLAIGMVGAPSVGSDAMSVLRTYLRTGGEATDGRRALELNSEAARRVEDDRRAMALEALGDALIARGQLRAGTDTMELAASVGWSLPRYHKLASAALALGDTARAVDAFAHVAADPLTTSTFADSVRALTGRHFDSTTWTASVGKTRTELRSRLLARTERTRVPNATFAGADGRSHKLSELVAGRPTLVAFWSMGCPYSVAQHPALAATARRLGVLGYNTIAVTHSALDSAMLATLKAQKLDFTPYRDDNNEARLAFAQWGTPEYFVLDGDGRIRARLRTLDGVAALLMAIDKA